MVRFYSAHRSAATLKPTAAEMNNIDHRSAIGSWGTLDPFFSVLYMPNDTQHFPPQTPLHIEHNSHVVAQKEGCHTAKSALEQSDRKLRASTWWPYIHL